MRAVLVVTGLMMAFGTPVSAQSPFEGPLAAPDSTSAAKPAKAKPRKAAKSARRTAPKTDEPAAYDPKATAPEAQPVAHAYGKALPGDPVEFGMKWNGSNDSARDTRVQNYDGSNPGTGAEVGMKLHF